jgi:hypothetical protein
MTKVKMSQEKYKSFRQKQNQVYKEKKNKISKHLFIILKIETCAICMDECTEPKQLDKCGHTFCTACIDHYFHQIKPQCPCCFTIYGEIRGISVLRFIFIF